MTSLHRATLLAASTVGIALLAPAASAGESAAAQEQPVGSTRLVSVDFSFSELLISEGDVSDGGTIATFTADSIGGPSNIYARRQGAAHPELISHANDGSPGDWDTYRGVVAPDGSFVVYYSRSMNLGPGNPFGDGDTHIYLHDNQTHRTRLISATADGTFGNGSSDSASVSPDSKFVVYRSDARNLAPGGQVGLGLYVFDVATGTTTAVDPGPGFIDSSEPAVSSGGRYVAFASTAQLAPGDTDNRNDIFRYDTTTGAIVLVSRGRGPESLGTARSVAPQISADGNRICYTSSSTNLVPDDPATNDDIFVADASTRTTQLVSRTPAGGWPNGPSADCDISADGRLVTYSSEASDLVGADPNGTDDIFVSDTGTSTTQLISRTPDGGPANAPSFDPSISADGRYVAFETAANLTRDDRDPYMDVVVHRLS